MADMVATTLEAFALEAAKTLQPEWGFDAPGEQHSVEVTQAKALQKTVEPGAASDNLQTNELPESHYIWNILGHRQFFPIGCEASAADDWAKYFGVEVNEFAFQVRLPISDNPDLGFVGDVNGPWGQVPPLCLRRARRAGSASVKRILRNERGGYERLYHPRVERTDCGRQAGDCMGGCQLYLERTL